WHCASPCDLVGMERERALMKPSLMWPIEIKLAHSRRILNGTALLPRISARDRIAQRTQASNSEGMLMNRWSIALAILSAVIAGTAAAQERPDAFPTRAIKIVVPFPAGGPSDVLARMIGQKMNEDWGQPVLVENRPGANTVLGAQQVAKAAPDGYTLLMSIDSTLTMNQYLYRTPPYDPFNDFAPITLTAKTMQLLIVNATSDVKSVKELIAKAK